MNETRIMRDCSMWSFTVLCSMPVMHCRERFVISFFREGTRQAIPSEASCWAIELLNVYSHVTPWRRRSQTIQFRRADLMFRC